MLFEALVCIVIILILAVIIYAAYWWGCNVRRTRDLREVQRGCKHENISYLEKLDKWVCDDCHTFFKHYGV